MTDAEKVRVLTEKIRVLERNLEEAHQRLKEEKSRSDADYEVLAERFDRGREESNNRLQALNNKILYGNCPRVCGHAGAYAVLERDYEVLRESFSRMCHGFAPVLAQLQRVETPVTGVEETAKVVAVLRRCLRWFNWQFDKTGAAPSPEEYGADLVSDITRALEPFPETT